MTESSHRIGATLRLTLHKHTRLTVESSHYVKLIIQREIKKGMDEALGLLSENGRLCVITFHSLEDRIVKNKMKTAACPCTCPPDFPVCVCGKRPQGKVITNKPIVASEIEQSENNRSHSAKLRVFEKRSDL